MMNGRISRSLNWDASEWSMKMELDHRLNAYGDAKVVRQALGADGNPTTGTASGYTYDITF